MLLSKLTRKIILQIAKYDSHEEPVCRSKIAKDVGCMYSSAYKIISKLKEEDFIKEKKAGRKKDIRFTAKGIMASVALQTLKTLDFE